MIDFITDCGAIDGRGTRLVPRDPLRKLFCTTVIDDWLDRPTEELRERIRILRASGPLPEDARQAREAVYYRAKWAAWQTYLSCGFACGLFEGDHGKELRGRLKSRLQEDFRGAMAECLAAWFLAGRMKLSLYANPRGRKNKNVDLAVWLQKFWVGVEVKPPFRKRSKGHIELGDDSDRIRQALISANEQLLDDRPNIVLLVPRLRWSLFQFPGSIVRAIYGQSVLTYEIGQSIGMRTDPEVEFTPDGCLLNRHTAVGAPLKRDGHPAHRRISVVLCIEETVRDKYDFPNPLMPGWAAARDRFFSSDNETWIDHSVQVFHNPFAYHAISEDHFADFLQVVPRDGTMTWSNGLPVIV